MAKAEVRDVLSVLVSCVAMRHAAENNATDIAEMESLQQRVWEAEFSSSASPSRILPPAGVFRRRSSRGETSSPLADRENNDPLMPREASGRTKDNDYHDNESGDAQASHPCSCSAETDADSRWSGRRSMEDRRSTSDLRRARIECAQPLGTAKLLFDEDLTHQNSDGSGAPQFSQTGYVFRFSHSARAWRRSPRRSICDKNASGAPGIRLDRALRRTSSSPYPYKLGEDVEVNERNRHYMGIVRGCRADPPPECYVHSSGSSCSSGSSNNTPNKKSSPQDEDSCMPSRDAGAVGITADNITSTGEGTPTEHAAVGGNLTGTKVAGHRERGSLRHTAGLHPAVPPPHYPPPHSSESFSKCQLSAVLPFSNNQPSAHLSFEAAAWSRSKRIGRHWRSNSTAAKAPQREAPSEKLGGRWGDSDDRKNSQRWAPQERGAATPRVCRDGQRNCAGRGDVGSPINLAMGLSFRTAERQRRKGADVDCGMPTRTRRSSCGSPIRPMSSPSQSAPQRRGGDDTRSAEHGQRGNDIAGGTPGKATHQGATGESSAGRSGGCMTSATVGRLKQAEVATGIEPPLGRSSRREKCARLTAKENHRDIITGEKRYSPAGHGEACDEPSGMPPRLEAAIGAATGADREDSGEEKNVSCKTLECRADCGRGAEARVIADSLGSGSGSECIIAQRETHAATQFGSSVASVSFIRPSAAISGKPRNVPRQSFGPPTSGYCRNCCSRFSTPSEGDGTPRRREKISLFVPSRKGWAGPGIFSSPSDPSAVVSPPARVGSSDDASASTATTFPFSTPGFMSTVSAVRDSSGVGRESRRTGSAGGSQLQQQQQKQQQQQQKQQQQKQQQQKQQRQPSPCQMSSASQRCGRGWSARSSNNERGYQSETCALQGRQRLAMNKRLKQLVQLESLTIQWERLPWRERKRQDRKQCSINSRFRVTEEARLVNSLQVYASPSCSHSTARRPIPTTDRAPSSAPDNAGRNEDLCHGIGIVHNSDPNKGIPPPVATSSQAQSISAGNPKFGDSSNGHLSVILPPSDSALFPGERGGVDVYVGAGSGPVITANNSTVVGSWDGCAFPGGGRNSTGRRSGWNDREATDGGLTSLMVVGANCV